MKSHLINIALFLLIMTSCFQKNVSQLEPQETQSTYSNDQLSKQGIAFATIRSQEYISHIQLNGFVEIPPSGQAEVHTVLPGFTHEIKLIVGDKVTKGQTLALLFSSDFIQKQQEYLEASSKVVFLKQEMERLGLLRDQKITSEKEYSNVLADYEIYKAKKSAFEQILIVAGINLDVIKQGSITNYIVIKSPITGEVTEVNTIVGKYHHPGEKIIEIMNVDHLHAELKVFEKDISKIYEGQKVEILTTASEKIYLGTVYRISNQIDLEGRFVRVHVHFNEGQKLPVVGSYLLATLVSKPEKIWVVNKEAIFNQYGKHYVWHPFQLSGSWNFKAKEVQIGKEINDKIEVLNMDSTLVYVSEGASKISSEPY